MVFTHLPSNVLLLLVAFAPSFPAAAALLVARALLSQLDVPTRQAYTMALVDPEERNAAAGVTQSVRGGAQAVSPVLTGIAMGMAAYGVPFLLAGGLKSLYDLSLYFVFRRVPLSEDAL
jgi:predicted MFS family arabinose efflux permease